MDKLKFLFGNHNHQPVGNFDAVFEQAMERSYVPFVDILKEYPDVRMALHFSGCLLDWIEAHQPEYLDDVAELARQGQIEVLSSGYYEPVLSAIPRWDRRDQLERMNSYIENRFGQRAKGAWMTERVWESHVVGSLVDSGLQYVVIDDYHFKAAGLEEDAIRGYFITENDGDPLAVFPIMESLRYTIPFSEPQETINHLRQLYDRGRRMAVMIDDGEKFGLWPGTHKLSYKEGWVRRFFDALMAEQDWLELATPAEILNGVPPTGMVYLPSASYFEMSEWTLPGDRAESFSAITHELQDNGQIDRYRPFLRGGIWRNFLTKYPESNAMHKRMLDISKRLYSAGRPGDKQTSEALEAARQHLHTAQCNCAYWHGVFGGLYLPHLRDAVYRELIAADTLSSPVNSAGEINSVEMRDYNLDGYPEAILRSDVLQAFVTPAYGAAVPEIDVLSHAFNLVNTLASRREGYHAAITAGQDSSGDSGGTESIHDINRNVSDSMRQELRYDWHNRYCFLDHFLPEDASLEAQRDRSFSELGDFVNQPFNTLPSEPGTFSRDGHLYIGDISVPISLVKRYSIENNTLTCNWEITSHGDNAVKCLFAPELNFSMLGGNDPEIAYFSGTWTKQKMTSAGKRSGTTRFGILDKRKGMRITLENLQEGDFWFFPSRTVSQSEKGFEMNYQSSVILNINQLELEPGKTITLQLNLTVESI